MEGKATVEEAKQLLGHNFIGIEELKTISDRLSIKIPSEIPEIPFIKEYLNSLNNEYLLILGSPEMEDGSPLSIMALRQKFGMDNKVSEPCFYNQDWYLNQEFINAQLPFQWFLVRKNVIKNTRAVDPNQILKSQPFPTAILCAYAFFVSWFHSGEILWEYDFVWCSDKDHNGDRIYVAKYHDIDGVNKNGFSIHRHLALRSCYGAI